MKIESAPLNSGRPEFIILFLDFFYKNAVKKKMQNNTPIRGYFLNKIKTIIHYILHYNLLNNKLNPQIL